MSDQLSPDERRLLDALQLDDTPDAAEQQRVKRRLFAQLGLGVATVAGSAAVGSTAVAPTAQAASLAPSAAGIAGASGSAAGTSAGAAGCAGVTGVASGAAKATTWGALATKLGTVKGVLGVTVALGAGGGAVWSMTADSPPPDPETPVVESRAAAPQDPSPNVAPDSAEAEPTEPESAETDEAPEPTTQAPRATPKSKRTTIASPTTSDVEAEAKLLSEAQRAIARGDSSRALGLLLKHQKTFPNGTLRLERQAALAIARCQAGQLERGRKDAERFRDAHPNSPMVRRLESACSLPPRQ